MLLSCNNVMNGKCGFVIYPRVIFKINHKNVPVMEK